jgi:hypothetical protein
MYERSKLSSCYKHVATVAWCHCIKWCLGSGQSNLYGILDKNISLFSLTFSRLYDIIDTLNIYNGISRASPNIHFTFI